MVIKKTSEKINLEKSKPKNLHTTLFSINRDIILNPLIQIKQKE